MEAIKFSKAANNAFRQIEASSALADCLLPQNRIKEALEYLEQAYQIAKQHHFNSKERDTALKLAQYYKFVDTSKYQFYSAQFLEISVKLTGNGGQQAMQYRTFADPPEN